MVAFFLFPMRSRKARIGLAVSTLRNKYSSCAAMKGRPQPSSSVALLVALLACSCSPNESKELSGRDPQGDLVLETPSTTDPGWRSPCGDRPCKVVLGVLWYPKAQFDNSGRLTYEKQDHDARDGHGLWIFRTNDTFARVFEFYKNTSRNARVYRVNVAGTPTGVIMKMEDNLLKIIQIQREGSETLFSISIMPTPAYKGKVAATGRDAR